MLLLVWISGFSVIGEQKIILIVYVIDAIEIHQFIVIMKYFSCEAVGAVYRLIG